MGPAGFSAVGVRASPSAPPSVRGGLWGLRRGRTAPGGLFSGRCQSIPGEGRLRSCAPRCSRLCRTVSRADGGAGCWGWGWGGRGAGGDGRSSVEPPDRACRRVTASVRSCCGRWPPGFGAAARPADPDRGTATGADWCGLRSRRAGVRVGRWRVVPAGAVSGGRGKGRPELVRGPGPVSAQVGRASGGGQSTRWPGRDGFRGAVCSACSRKASALATASRAGRVLNTQLR